MKAEEIKHTLIAYKSTNIGLDEACKEIIALTTQPQSTMSADEILDDELSISMSEYLKENPIFKEWIKDAMYRYAAQLQPFEVIPPRNEQEEADRLVELFADIDFEDSVLRSIQVVSYHRDNLKLRGLSTTFEEKVLTILKGM